MIRVWEKMERGMQEVVDSLLKELSFLLSKNEIGQHQKYDQILGKLLTLFQKKVNITEETVLSTMTISGLEAIGYNCLMLSQVLSAIDKNAVQSYSAILSYIEDAQFRNYCIDALRYFEEKARDELKQKGSPTAQRSIEVRKTELEQTNQSEIAELYAMSQEYKRAAEEAMKRAEQLKKEAEETKKVAEGIVPNMLTVLGVFIAIIIAVVACYLSLIFNQHQENPLPSLNIIQSLLMGQIIMDIIFLLLYLISKLTNYTLACHCFISREVDCSQCPNSFRNNCRLWNRVWLRYPYVVIFNTVFIVCYFVLGVWGFLSIYLGKGISSLLRKSPQAVLCVAAIATVLFILICVIVFYKMSWKRTTKKTFAEKRAEKQRMKMKEKEQRAKAKQEKSVKLKELKKDIDSLSQRVEVLEKSSNHESAQV